MSATAATFSTAAPKVLRWILLRRWIALLGRTAWLAAGGVLTTAVLSWLLFGGVRPWPLASVLLVWLIATATVAWYRKPGAFSAFALWDQADGRREAFANAWWFERQPTPTASETEHITEQKEPLSKAMPMLARSLPLQPARSIWLAPTLAVLSLLIPAVFSPRIAVETITDAMQQQAAEEAKKLAAKDWEKKNLPGLTEQEKQELENLQKQLQKTAAELETSSGKDAREVLSQLEKRAREAESLAAKLGGGQDAWASEQMIDELRRQADTADLGDAVAEKKAANAAKAADSLASQLKSPQLKPEARERVNETLKNVQKQAQKEDRQRIVGENVLAAGDRMAEAKSAEAGGEFEKLAEKMREIARREQTRKELEQLAQQLRDAGSNITGQSSGGMQQMAEAGQQSSGQQSGQSPQVPQSGQQNQGGQQPLTPPGLGQNQQQGQMSQTPSPGTGQGQQLPMFSQQPPGQGQSGQGKPALFAPIPGPKPGEKPEALLFGQGSPNGNPDAAIMMTAPGGNQPGAGTAKLNNDPTARQQSDRQGMVTAQSSSDGQSTFRSVEGGAKKESAARTATATALEAIQAEEEALDEAALPPSRREQVRRYFTELRKRFEKQD